MEERVMYFQIAYPDKLLSVSALERLYKANRIRRKVVRISKSLPPAGIPNIERQRDDVLKRLGWAADNNLEVVYIDEIVFSRTTMKRSEWSACK